MRRLLGRSLREVKHRIEVAGEVLFWRWRVVALADTIALPELLARLTPSSTRSWHPSTLGALGHADRMARRLGLPNTCLYRSLVRYRVLRRRGLDVRFVVGAGAAKRGDFEAHAWLELDGAVFAEEPRAFQVLFRYPATETS